MSKQNPKCCCTCSNANTKKQQKVYQQKLTCVSLVFFIEVILLKVEQCSLVEVFHSCCQLTSGRVIVNISHFPHNSLPLHIYSKRLIFRRGGIEGCVLFLDKVQGLIRTFPSVKIVSERR